MNLTRLKQLDAIFTMYQRKMHMEFHRHISPSLSFVRDQTHKRILEKATTKTDVSAHCM